MHGLWPEMKVKGNLTTPAQDEWILDLTAQG
jgi:hypothetical protein